MTLLTHAEFDAAVDRLARVFIGPNGLARAPELGDDPQRLYVKLADVRILWSRLEVPEVVHLLSDLQETVQASHSGHLGPYAALERVEAALESYREAVRPS